VLKQPGSHVPGAGYEPRSDDPSPHPAISKSLHARESLNNVWFEAEIPRHSSSRKSAFDEQCLAT
jgi:hypothetical protein